ncbi:pentapeptide repeat-containing protein [Streptomyces massasporeus]
MYLRDLWADAGGAAFRGADLRLADLRGSDLSTADPSPGTSDRNSSSVAPVSARARVLPGGQSPGAGSCPAGPRPWISGRSWTRTLTQRSNHLKADNLRISGDAWPVGFVNHSTTILPNGYTPRPCEPWMRPLRRGQYAP